MSKGMQECGPKFLKVGSRFLRPQTLFEMYAIFKRDYIGGVFKHHVRPGKNFEAKIAVDLFEKKNLENPGNVGKAI